MGEMADYMLNGDDCQSCGEYLGRGDGYPRSCAGCQEEVNFNEIEELIQEGLSKIRTAAIILREADHNRKSKGLHNLCDQISIFAKSLK